MHPHKIVMHLPGEKHSRVLWVTQCLQDTITGNYEIWSEVAEELGTVWEEDPAILPELPEGLAHFRGKPWWVESDLIKAEYLRYPNGECYAIVHTWHVTLTHLAGFSRQP